MSGFVAVLSSLVPFLVGTLSSRCCRLFFDLFRFRLPTNPRGRGQKSTHSPWRRFYRLGSSAGTTCTPITRRVHRGWRSRRGAGVLGGCWCWCRCRCWCWCFLRRYLQFGEGSAKQTSTNRSTRIFFVFTPVLVLPGVLEA